MARREMTMQFMGGCRKTAALVASICLSIALAHADGAGWTSPTGATKPVATAGKSTTGPAGVFSTLATYEDPKGQARVVPLADGRILLVTGDREIGVWDPIKRSWRHHGLPKDKGMRTGRMGLSKDAPVQFPDGRILMGPALADAYYTSGVSNAALWNPATEAWEYPQVSPPDFRGQSVVRLADGRALFLGGGAKRGESDKWIPDTGFVSAEVLDGATKTDVAPMNSGRHDHSATVLPDGRVLVVGGIGGASIALSSTEIWDSALNTWTIGPSLLTGRARHAAVLLADGRVMVAGGIGEFGNDLESVEILDASGKEWSPAEPLLYPVTSPAAATLADGNVLLAATPSGSDRGQAFAMLWNGAEWTPAGFPHRFERQNRVLLERPPSQVLALADGSALHVGHGVVSRWQPVNAEDSATSQFGNRAFNETRLVDGRWLLTGGRFGDNSGIATDWAEIFDPATGRFRRTGRMQHLHMDHQSILLQDGRVLVVGGWTRTRDRQDGGAQPVAEVWDPATGQWQVANMFLPDWRYRIDCARQESGAVLCYGAHRDDLFDHPAPDDSAIIDPDAPAHLAWLWDPRSDRSEVKTVPFAHRPGMLPAIFPDGRIVVGAGDTATVWDTHNGSVTTDRIPTKGKQKWLAFAARSGQVLLLETHPFDWRGERAPPKASAALLWEPTSRNWTRLSDLPEPHYHVFTGIAEFEDGTVYLEGMHFWLPPNSQVWEKVPEAPVSLEVYRVGGAPAGFLEEAANAAAYLDPRTRQWVVKAETYVPRWFPLLVQLADGRVWVGGSGPGERVAQLWDPRDDSWTSAPLLAPGLEARQAVRTPSGHILSIGANLEKKRVICERWGPDETTWQPCGDWPLVNMPERRPLALGSLPDGRAVLLREAEQALVSDASGTRWELTPLKLNVHPSSGTTQPDGRLGFNGLPSASVWDKESQSWIDLTALAESWLTNHGALTLPDGRVVTSRNRFVWEPTQRLWAQSFGAKYEKWGPQFALLPDGCIANFSPFRIGEASAKQFRAVPWAPFDLDGASMLKLVDGTVFLAGRALGAGNSGRGYWRFKADCTGVIDVGAPQGTQPGGSWPVLADPPPPKKADRASPAPQRQASKSLREQLLLLYLQTENFLRFIAFIAVPFVGFWLIRRLRAQGSD